MSAPSNIGRPGAGTPSDGSAECESPTGSASSLVVPAASSPPAEPARSVQPPVEPARSVQPPVEPARSVQPPAEPARSVQLSERGRRSPRRLLTAVFGVLIAVAGLVLLVPRPNATPLQTVDVAAAARAADPVLGFSPSVPSGLRGWTATIAVVRHGASNILTWHVGFVTSRGDYAGIEQATRSDDTWENALDSGGMWVGTVTVDGTIWDHREKAERNTTALILRRPGRVTLITAKGGGVSDAVTLIRSLPPDTLS